MKRNLISATVIATLLAAPAAFAMERPQFVNPDSRSLMQKDVIAGSIFSTKELTRRGLAADDSISVSVIPSVVSTERYGRG